MTAVPPTPTPGADQAAPTRTAGPVRLGPDAHATLRPDARATISDGFWADRRRTNAETSLRQGPQRLAEAGNLENFRRAADRETGGFLGGHPFQDTDVHKWLEAAAWQLGDPDLTPERAAELAGYVEEFTALLGRAQEPSGYLNSFYQVAKPEVPHFTELAWGHELYTAGHLIQAAVALSRTTGRRELLDLAVRFADHIDESFGPAGSGKPVDSVDGHPEIETALVELARETGQARYTALAQYFVDRHGGALDTKGRRSGHGSPGYYQDHTPPREAPAVTGHAVRQLYLLAGVADVATETGDAELRAAAERLWTDMAARQTYLTGGIGAHHSDEAFGDPYELPNERAYAETCAAIASVHLNWRMTLLTGEARYSDLAERTLYNGVLCGVSLSGDQYLYDNPLHVRDTYADREGDKPRRTPWFSCACCPPNLMRLLASLPHYLASTSADRSEVQVHQYATGTVHAELATGPVALRVATDYPWQGSVGFTVETGGAGPWTLALRIPHWSAGTWKLTLDGTELAADTHQERDGWLRVTRDWRAGEILVLDLDVTPRLTRADSRVDAARGCVAIERGPLVYAVERLDQPALPAGCGLDDLVVDPATELASVHRPDLLDGVTTVTATARVRPRPAPADRGDWWPYRPADAGHPAPTGEPITLTAIPYYAWANRENSPMRVWLAAE
ncbi:glycoside hydrolase family 127 protein [Streptomyces sp. DSM 44915]|uniref:Glycoside hydrolase family 127 protein n=1 Tax=Streptomyces chisholmiae TaxID=3075540 RepID=A0ABU2JS19_9ACTN|nr:beta-L-arabinofuranosidase domain-containing protein [Streptomyces sp. DSM 44915]MDT0267319.1 glycoside hydrolase family 127 protein [Streptomyces sp. DSM 44915]